MGRDMMRTMKTVIETASRQASPHVAVATKSLVIVIVSLSHKAAGGRAEF